MNMKLWKRSRALLIAALVAGPLSTAGLADDSWTHWRGEGQRGVASGAEYPVQWDLQQDVPWRMDIPGRGGSTPVVTGSTILLTTGYDGQNHLMAIDAATGDQRWDVALGEDTGGKHKKGSGSNPSPTTDGQRVYAYYRSGDLACVDLEGNVLWRHNLQEKYGEDTLWWDLGSSPLLTENAVVVAAMQSPPSPSYLVAFNKETGEVLWKTDRELDAPEESAQSYTSPLLAEVDGRAVIATLGADHLTLHDADSGKELGRIGGLNPGGERFFRSIASPVIDGNIIVCPYARGESLTAVDMAKLIAGEGEQAIVWRSEEFGADVPTPAARDGRLYLCGDRGEVRALDIRTGEEVWMVELPRNRNNYSSSPLVTDSHVYLTREDGQVFVVALPGEDGEARVVAENTLGDDRQYTVASPIPVDGDLIFRTAGTLVRIGGE